MASASRRSRPRVDAPARLWALAALPALCVATYPVLVLAHVMPLAGLVALLAIIGALVVAVYASQRGLLSWSVGWALATWVNVSVGLAAWLGDGARLDQALDATFVTTLSAMFALGFLFWLVADLAPGALVPRSGSTPVRRQGKADVAPRAGLTLVLLLGLLLLGLGAVWARAMDWVPSPVPWVVGLALSSFALMFAERLRFFVRSARDGNLLLELRAREKWIAAGVLVLIAAALIAAAFPWNPPTPQLAERPPGTRIETGQAPSGGMSELGRQLTQQAQSFVSSAASAFAAAPRVFTFLWLLLLLFLVALVLVWVFSRTRAARWLLMAVAALLDRMVRLWRRMAAALARLLRRPRPTAPAGAEADRRLLAADPLLDIFEDEAALARLSARQIAIHTYHLMLNFAEMLGRGRGPGQTPFEYARLLTGAVPAAKHAIAALTWGYANAMYGAEDAALPPANAVRDSWRRVSQVLTEDMAQEDVALRRDAYLASRALRSSESRP